MSLSFTIGCSTLLPVETDLITYQTHPDTEEELQKLLLRRVENLVEELTEARRLAARKIKKIQI